MFKSQNFCHIASNNRNLVKVGVFTYRTTDSLETVLTSGYFNERIIDINLHDLIIHEKISAIDSTVVERNILCVVERTLDNVGTVLIQSDWEKGIDQTIEDILDQLETFVKIDGSSVMTGDLQTPNVRLTGKGGITAKVGSSDINLVKLNNDSALGKVEVGQGNVPTQVSSATFTHKLAGVDYKVLDNNDTATPVSDTNKVITQAEEQVLYSKIDTAANSGDQLYSTGVWYAKMYAGTTPPASAEIEGRNYADFSQTDGSGNPVIKVYTYTSGSWTLTDTIVPPTEYNGYMTITSKIWDISEQAGQQGGKVLWSHNQKTFTPYPQIISFENAALTGVSTAPTPTDDSPDNQIATKEYVDNATPSGSYHPDLFDVKWADHICNDVQWLRADTFSWQSGAVYQAAYQHLADEIGESIDILIPAEGLSFTYMRYKDGDIAGYYAWEYNGQIAYTDTLSLSVGDNAYLSLDPVKIGEITAINNHLQSETVAGTTIQFYLADDGHKICPASEESNVSAIYTATGVAWYYIIDTANTRFKLPRTQFAFTGIRNGVGGFVEAGLPNITGWLGLADRNNNAAERSSGAFKWESYGTAGFAPSSNTDGKNANFDASLSNSIYGNSDTVQPKATEMYLYFYVGNFTQTALENTAGITTEEMNNKVNIGHEVIEFQAPTADNNYTWYRKYADGWVEQGGKQTGNKSISLGYAGSIGTITLPVEMKDTDYYANAVCTTYCMLGNVGKTETTVDFQFMPYQSARSLTTVFWEVKGMAA